MPRPITLFTGQWADLPFEEVCEFASSAGYDGVEIACSGDHFDVQQAVDDDSYVQGRKDNNFNAPGFPIVNYDNFTVVDASVTYNLARRHAIVATINNMFDAFYYEKLGYPLQGASFRVSYRFGF